MYHWNGSQPRKLKVNPDGDEELIKAIKTSELKELSAWKIYNASKDDLINSLMEFTTGYLNWIKKQEKMSVEINLDETEKNRPKLIWTIVLCF